MATPKKTKTGYTAHAFLGFREGKRVYKSITAPTIREWNMKLAQAKLDFANQAEAASDRTIKDTVERYIAARSNVLSPTTMHSYLWVQDSVLGDFANVSARDLTARQLQIWVNDISARLSPKSVRNALGVVNSSVAMFYSGKRFKVTLPQKDVMEYHIPDDKDVRRLIEAASGDLRKAIYLSAFGSLRRSEIGGLRYADVLRDMNAIFVHAARVKQDHVGWIYKEHPKNSSSVRQIIYPKEIIAILGTGDPEEYVIRCTPATITTQFSKLARGMGLLCRLHDMRHYAASLMHAIGVPDQYILERGGWKTDHTLKAIYRNTLRDKNHQFTKLTNQYFVDNFSKKKAL